ncbi:hypothetical protein [Staphylococcus equorum]|uniref:hypothetical protein n=1 Tax=Staphylococcus equorum TaxID=246432 RepID=UPI003FD72B73
MSDRTMYVNSVEVINPRFAEAYTYRRNGENLGILGVLAEDGRTWIVHDFMNEVEQRFDSKNKAKEFIKNNTPIYV